MFVESFQDLCKKIEEHKAIIVIFVDSNILLPSQSLLKFFSFNPVSQQLSQNVYIFKNVDATVYEQYKVFQFPQVTVIKEKPHNVLYSFVGCNQEKGAQALSILCEALNLDKPHMKLNIQKKYCPAKHEMQFINQIDESLYRYGCFQCNGCNMLSHVDSDKPVFHCSVCSYDLCYACTHTNTVN